MKKLPSWAVAALSLLGVAVLGAVLAAVVLRGACAAGDPITTMPSATAEPVAEPTAEPTEAPKADATEEQAAEPTPAPTEEPTAEPTGEPAPEPTAATNGGKGLNDLPDMEDED